jgi:hypothetical protein
MHIHHLTPHSEGGTTTPDNLIALCSGCHRNLHLGLLKIVEQPDKTLIFTDHNGRRLDQQANLEIAHWIDFWLGWKGEPLDAHAARAVVGEWAVFR